MGRNKKLMNRTSVITAALVAALPFVADVIIFGSTGRAARMFEQPITLLLNAAFAAAPFIFIGLVMAARRSVTRALWSGAILTVMLWGAFAWSGRSYGLSQEGGTLNIALFMILMIWPFIVTIFMGLIGMNNLHKVDGRE